MRNRLFLLTFFMAFWSPAGYGQAVWEDIERIVAVGDIHGAYEPLLKLLRGAGLIDEKLAWRGGRAHLVSVGDLLDRGPRSRQTMDLFMSLQPQAAEAGGRVHVLLGNHELMNLSGDLRDVSDAEYTALEELGGHQAAFSSHGRYGRWLLEQPVMIRINDTLFTHGGLPPMLLQQSQSLETLNSEVRQDLKTLLQEAARLYAAGVLEPGTDLLDLVRNPDDDLRDSLGVAFVNAASSPLLGDDGPLWYRGTASCHHLLEAPILTAVLAHFGAQRVVVGHTPTADREINARFEQRAWLIDTGMLAPVYRGNPRLLAITADGIDALDDQGAATAVTHLPRSVPLVQLGSEAFEMQAAAAGVTPVTFAADAAHPALPAIFTRSSAREARRAVAAHRLDRHLGLNMVPATMQRTLEKKRGFVMAWQNRPFSEAARQQAQLSRPNWCARSSDYALLAAFDALIGKTDRSPENLYYERGTLNIRIIENENAFGTATALPQTAMSPSLPAPMVQPLTQLNADNLNALLGDLLKSGEIRALLKRRDAILRWPVSP